MNDISFFKSTKHQSGSFLFSTLTCTLCPLRLVAAQLLAHRIGSPPSAVPISYPRTSVATSALASIE